MAAEFPASVVLHTSVPFGVDNVERTVPEMEPILKEALQRSFPNLPMPKAVKCHKWRYSQVLYYCWLKRYIIIKYCCQVTKSYEGQPGALELSAEPPLLVAGDAFTHSNFDGCVTSADKVVKLLTAAMF